MKIYPVLIQMAPPDGDFPGIVEEGLFTVADGDTVTLCTRDGVPVVDASGRKRSALVRTARLPNKWRRGYYARACRSAGAPRASINQSATPRPTWSRALRAVAQTGCTSSGGRLHANIVAVMARPCSGALCQVAVRYLTKAT
jgi:hypothetical protein